jgi:putative glutamine amidotransferase
VLDIQQERPEDIVRHVSGVVLPGGNDVNPALYGEPPHPTYEPVEDGRDEFELDLVRRALEADLPVFAICRGIQVLNVARGGSLVQDIPDQVPSAGKHMLREPTFAIAHEVWLHLARVSSACSGPGSTTRHVRSTAGTTRRSSVSATTSS